MNCLTCKKFNMALKTALYDLCFFPDVYDPREDTFLFLDALEKDIDFIKALRPTCITEIGCGSGVVITSLGLVLRNHCQYFATDINPTACLATAETARKNNVTIECLNMDMLFAFKNARFDIILFNPPYVVTEGQEITGRGINRSWAGGNNGREVIDRILPKLYDLLSKTGICYLVIIKENEPDEIKNYMLTLGFNTYIIIERKILGEHLFVLRFNKM